MAGQIPASDRKANPNLRPTETGPNTLKEIENKPLPDVAATEILRLDVSGQNGSPGRDGIGYRNNKVGKDGRDGNHGTNGNHGQDAGEISLSLAVKDETTESFMGFPIDGELGVEGFVKMPKEAVKAYQDMLRLRSNAVIQLIALGGNGGRGGNGSSGERGSRGRDGRDASKFSSGTNGTNGGDGGNGGNGGRGGNAGAGGKLTINLSGLQTHLLMLLKLATQAGVAGEGGAAGSGGSGGSGGRGGRSYSWREQVGKDSEGRPIYRSYSKSGGRDGFSGSSGRSGSPGARGTGALSGNHQFNILGDGGVPLQQSQGLFELSIVDYELVDAYEDGIYEFGERVFIRNLRVQNIGQLALPKGRHTYVYFLDTDWVDAEALALRVPLGLEPGESYTFEEELAVRIRRPKAQKLQARPFKVPTTLLSQGIMGGVLRAFERAPLNKTLALQFPVLISPIIGHHSVARGNASRISWEIANLSQTPLGLYSEMGRLIQTHFSLSQPNEFNRLKPEHILFFDADGQPLDLNSGWTNDIHLLRPGKENAITIDTYVGIHPDADPITTNEARCELRFSHPDARERIEPIQYSPFQLKVAKTYGKTPDSDILLLINRDTHLQTVEEILAYYAALDSKVDVWDISHYGFLDFEKELENGSNMLEDFEGKTIILLNQPFLANQRETVYSSDFLSKSQFLRAANDYGIDIYVIGQTTFDEEALLHQLSLPTVAPQAVSRYESFKAFWARIDKRHEESIRVDEGLLDAPLGEIAQAVDNFSNRADVIEVKRNYPFSWFNQPTEEFLHRRARKIARLLQKRYPQEQFYVIYDFQPEPLKRWAWGLNQKYKLGTLTVRQGPHKVNGGNILAIQTEAETLKDGSFFQQADTHFHLLLGLTIWESQEVLQSFMQEQAVLLDNNETLQSLLKAFMFHIATEQANLRTGSYTYLYKDELEEQLVYLKMVLNFSLGFTPYPSVQAIFYWKLFAHISAMLESQHYWLNFLIPQDRHLRLTRVVKKMMKRWLKANFDTSFALRRKDRSLWEQNKADKKDFQEKVKELKTELKNQFLLKARKDAQRARRHVAMDTYLDKIQTGALRPNYTVDQKTYLHWQETSEVREDRRTELQRKEEKLIQNLTFQLIRGTGEMGEEQFLIDWKDG